MPLRNPLLLASSAEVIARMTQAQGAAPQPGAVRAAARRDAAGALRQQAGRAAGCARVAGAHALAPRRHRPHVPLHQPGAPRQLRPAGAAGVKNICALSKAV